MQTGKVLDDLQKWHQEDQRTLIGKILSELGETQRQQLLSFFSATDLSFLFPNKDRDKDKDKDKDKDIQLISSNGQRLDISETEKSLENLGINIHKAFKLEIPTYKNREFIKLNQNEIPKKYNAKELYLLLSKDIPNPDERKAIIELFFVRGYHKQIDIFLLQIMKDIDTITGYNKKEPDKKSEIYSIGNNFEEVEEEKKKKFGEKKLRINRKLNRGTADILHFQDFVKKIKDKSINKTESEGSEKNYYYKNDDLGGFYVDKDWFEYVVTQKEKLGDFVKSTFCFCVSQLAQIPENIGWAVEPNKSEFTIPDWVKQKMQLIFSIEEYYNMNPRYSHLLKNATKAFIRVHNGIGE